MCIALTDTYRGTGIHRLPPMRGRGRSAPSSRGALNRAAAVGMRGSFRPVSPRRDRIRRWNAGDSISPFDTRHLPISQP